MEIRNRMNYKQVQTNKYTFLLRPTKYDVLLYEIGLDSYRGGGPDRLILSPYLINAVRKSRF